MKYTADGMSMNEETAAGRQYELSYQMIYLISCALHDVRPEKSQTENLDLSALYELSEAHSLAATVCMALEAADIFSFADPVIVKRWRDAKNKAIRKNMLLDAEREQIFKEMDKAGIWYMPLKGCILKNFYPKYGMRQMADNDILFDASRQADVKKIMVKRGYEVKDFQRINEDVYEKQPVYNYEMHTSLFGKRHEKSWQDYYAEIKTRLIADDDGSCGYHFTDEDFYVYFIVHAYKHFAHAGTGLRSLVDNYIYIWKKGNTLNWDYIREELEKLGAADYEQKSRELAMKLFSAPVLPDEITLTKTEREMLAFFVGNGTYGNLENLVKSNIKEMKADGNISAAMKARYCFNRLFPPLEWYDSIPFCRKHKWAIPFYAVFRIIRTMICRSRAIYAELQVVRKIRRDDGRDSE